MMPDKTKLIAVGLHHPRTTANAADHGAGALTASSTDVATATRTATPKTVRRISSRVTGTSVVWRALTLCKFRTADARALARPSRPGLDEAEDGRENHDDDRGPGAVDRQVACLPALDRSKREPAAQESDGEPGGAEQVHQQ